MGASRKKTQTLSVAIDITGRNLLCQTLSRRVAADPFSEHAPFPKIEEVPERLESRFSESRKLDRDALERALAGFSKRGVLRRSIIFLGASSDPFFPFERKFDKAMQVLALFERYVPGLLVVQTRSPLVVLALPVLKKLGDHCCVRVGIETPHPEIASKYTPHLPRIEERWKLLRTLKKFGIESHACVQPLLPYGDWKKEAASFARQLVEAADTVSVAPMLNAEGHSRDQVLGQKLAENRYFHYLRPDSHYPLLKEIEALSPEALIPPKRLHLEPQQLDMFAA